MIVKKIAGRMFFILLAAFAVPAAARAMSLPAIAKEDPDVRTDRLCAEAADPDSAADKIHINCKLEYGTFAPSLVAASATTGGKRELLAVAYNIERGMTLDKQSELLASDPNLGKPDIIFVSEADRGCSRTNYRNTARELAKTLGMNYVYGVEYIELPRKSDKPVNNNVSVCEHGNAVLSRFPILGADQIRYKETAKWYIPPGPKRDNAEPRLGGCMAVLADIDVAGETLRAYTMHLDGGTDMSGARASQVRELLAHAKDFKGPVIMGGDMNAYSYIGDVQAHTRKDSATSIFLDAGWKDAHAAVRTKDRSTINKSYPFKAIIDLIFLRGADAISSGVCPLKTCNDLSDHLPIWSRIQFDAGGK